eukprot:9395739-Pyramimonas_sp.AAC.1
MLTSRATLVVTYCAALCIQACGIFVKSGPFTLVREELTNGLSNDLNASWAFVENNYARAIRLATDGKCVVFVSTCGTRPANFETEPVVDCNSVLTVKAARRFRAFIVNKPAAEDSLKRLGVNAFFTPIWSTVDLQGFGDYLLPGEVDLTPNKGKTKYIVSSAGSKSSFRDRNWSLLLSAFNRRKQKELLLVICSELKTPPIRCNANEGCILKMGCSQSQANTLLKHSLAYVFTVKTNTIPRGLRSVSQALANGVPIISPRTAYLDGYIHPNNTIFYPMTNVKALTGAINFVAAQSQSYKDLRSNVERDSERFGTAKVAPNTQANNLYSTAEDSLKGKRLGVNAIFTPIWSTVDLQGFGDYLLPGEVDLTQNKASSNPKAQLTPVRIQTTPIFVNVLKLRFWISNKLMMVNA